MGVEKFIRNLKQIKKINLTSRKLADEIQIQSIKNNCSFLHLIENKKQSKNFVE